MDNNSGTLILLIVLIVSASLLIALKLTRFVNDFGRRKRYFLIKMCRADGYKEYCNWRRELRCLYLCLIPFITERNVRKVYPIFFRKAKHASKEKRSDGLAYILAPSMLAICICAVCLCGVSWAWFTSSTATGTTAIQSSSYKLLYQVGNDTVPTELAEPGTAYTLTSDTTVITLKAIGTAGARGYCSIKVGNETYCTEQISTNDTSGFTFTVNAAAGTTITLTPKWGTYSHTATLYKGYVITATGSQQGNPQAPDNIVTTEPSAEPTVPTAPTTPSSTPANTETTAPEPSATAPTAPATPSSAPANTETTAPEPSATASAAPTTPSSTPAESETTAPEPSATTATPTQPEPTDTEPAPAPETATPENTTAASTEPPTAETSENN